MNHIAFITDLHISAKSKNSSGINTRENFRRILASLSDDTPDHIIIGGDLCWKSPKKEIYEWIKPQLDALKIPYDIIAGNHDDVEMMAASFNFEKNLINKELYYVKQIGHQNFIFLDTSKGYMSETQYKFLSSSLSVESNPIIIMHHPPIIANIPYMDRNHCFKENDKIKSILKTADCPPTIFCGHYHVEKSIFNKECNVHITPSCYIQVSSTSETFEVDHYRIGYRDIWLDTDKLITSVRYL